MKARWRRFAYEYVRDFNGTQAAIRSGFSQNPRTACNTAVRLLQHPEVAAFVETLAAEQHKRCELEADRVKAEIARVAYSNIEDFVRMTQDGLEIDLTRCTRDQLAGVGSLEEEVRYERSDDTDKEPTKVVTTKIRMRDKRGPLQDAAKILGLLKDGTTLEITEETLKAIDEGWERVERMRGSAEPVG